MNNKITYHREGDYFIPDLCFPKQPDGHIGKYGRLRLNYLKDFRRGLYTELMISGELSNHLTSIDEDATKTALDIISKLAEKKKKKLKQDNQMEWIQAMNNIKNKAEEIEEKDKNLKGKIETQGTTPRRYTDLIGSLCDLTSGSGDKGTPVVFIQGYFTNYAD